MGKLENNTFARYCNNPDNVDSCLCDFRINLRGCPDENRYITALKCLVSLICLNVIISISFVYYRVKVKKQSIFFPATRERGLIRPRPQDSFHVAVGIFNFSQLLVSICLITDLFPNVTVAESIVYIPRLLGFACAVLYPISIIYSTPILKQTSYSLRLQWNPNKIFIDMLAIYLMLGPLLTVVPLTALAGSFADRNDYNTAIAISNAQSFVWSSWSIQYFVTLLYVYYKLICMLRGYIDILERRRSENSDVEMKIKKLNGAARNLTRIVFAVLLIFLITSLEGIIVGFIYRKKDVKNTVAGVFFISWYFSIPVLTFIGQMIFLYDTLKNRKSSQHQRNNNSYDRINNIPSHLEQKPAPMIKNNPSDLSATNDQKSNATMFIPTNNDSSNSAKKNNNNSISVEVKTTILSSTGTSTWETKSGSRNYTSASDIIEYYLEGDEEDKGAKSSLGSDARKSWLTKTPIRSVSVKKHTPNKNLFLQD